MSKFRLLVTIDCDDVTRWLVEPGRLEGVIKGCCFLAAKQCTSGPAPDVQVLRLADDIVVIPESYIESRLQQLEHDLIKLVEKRDDR